jgi:DNA-binding MarR family transcriptional regulator
MASRNRAELLESLSTEVRKFIAAAIFFNVEVAARLGLNATDLQCLNILEMQGTATPGELAKWTRLTTGGVTVALDRLEKAGYVRREPNPDDRRSSLVRLAPARAAKLRAIYRSKGRLLAKALAKYNADELSVLEDFFRTTGGPEV